MSVQIVPFDREFFLKSQEWLRDEEIRYLTQTPLTTLEENEKWYDSLLERKDYLIWGVQFDGIRVGVSGIKKIDREKRVGEYFGYIGEKDSWGKGIGKDMLRFVIQKAKEINLEKIVLYVIADNHRAIRLYESMGFKECGRSKELISMRLYLIDERRE